MENLNQFNYKPLFAHTLEQIPISKVDQKEPTAATNLCITCRQNSRAVAFVPCAHYVTCLPCGHGTTECPVCQSKIMACIRIYE